MRKLLSRVVALLIVAMMAAPAASAQAKRGVAELSGVTVSDGRLPYSAFQGANAPNYGPDRSAQFSKKVTASDARALLNRKHGAFAPSFAAGSKTFNGVVIYEQGMYYASDINMYTFSAAAPATKERVSFWSIWDGVYGAVMGEKYYYVVDAMVSYDVEIHCGYVFDPETWEVVKRIDNVEGLSALMQAAAYDPITGNIYAASYTADGKGLQFGIFDPETFTCKPLAEAEREYRAFSCTLDGTLYAIDNKGNFGTVDKATGKLTVIKATGIECDNLTSGAIDYMAKNPTFYYATSGSAESMLYAIDCATGDDTVVYTFPNREWVGGMYFQRPQAEFTAPDMARIDDIDFQGQELSGTISFTAPATLYNGDKAPAGQKLRYEVIANGSVVRTGDGLDYGHSYKVKVDLDSAGLYAFHIVVYNEVGPAPKSKTVSKWIGPDAPTAVKNVAAAWADGKMTVSWNKVADGVHGGTIGNVTYAVYNAADSTLIKDAITETSYAFDVKKPAAYTEFQYFVVATSDGMESPAGLSNVVALGDYVTPLHTAINKDAASNWTIIDANNDYRTWSLTATDAQYNYSSSNDGDDWLITSPIIVKKGYLYTVTVMACAYSKSYPEKFEVKAGSAATAQAMTIEVIPATTVDSRDYVAYTGQFMADSEMMYVGIHAISDAYQWTLYVNELSIDGGLAANAPDVATDLNVVVPYSGENKATLTYTAPTLTVIGDELSGDKALTRIEVLVNGKIEYVDNQPKAGAVSSIEIPVPTFGVYDFEVIAYNAYGAGQTAKASAYVGINKPAAATGMKITEVADGVVDITWNAVTTDVDGNIMNPVLVKYIVANPVWGEDGQLADLEIMAEDLTAPELKGYKAVAKDEQAFVQYIIVAYTEAGQSLAITPMVPVGTPFALPYTDTFADGRPQHILALGDGDPWSVFNDDQGIVSRNQDNGFIATYANIQYGIVRGAGFGEVITAKIAVNEKDPELSFYFFGITPTCRNTIETRVICDGDTTSVDMVQTAGKAEWVRHVVDMKAYAGKTVRVMLRAKYVNASLGAGWHGFIDDIRLGDPVKIDIAAKNISAPSTVGTESAFNVDYTLLNQGTDTAKNVVVSLYANGNLVESCVDTVKIAPNAAYTGTFDKEAFTIFEAGTYEFSFVADCEGDQDLTNNSSATVKVVVNNHEFPALQLAGTSEVADTTATVNLTWEVPAVDVTSYQLVESFESASYPAFTVEDFAGWTLLNFNESNTYTVGESNSYPYKGAAIGWQLYNAVEAGVADNSAYAAYEGSSYMVAFAHESGANDAWLISPYMNGVAQTVTFYAKSATTEYGPESMECLISTTGKAVADFTKVEIQGGYDATRGVPAKWTQYSIDLPAGTTYFAIRSTANNCYMLMIDNIDYYYVSPFVNLELVGYDVYRDQVKLTKEPITVEQYTDTLSKEGKYRYQVVAVYNQGNAAPSNVFEADVHFTGIADAVAGVRVAVEGSEIVVSGAEAVTIAAVDGKLVYAGQSGRVAVAPGIYVVKADATTAKVIVK